MSQSHDGLGLGLGTASADVMAKWVVVDVDDVAVPHDTDLMRTDQLKSSWYSDVSRTQDTVHIDEFNLILHPLLLFLWQTFIHKPLE